MLLGSILPCVGRSSVLLIETDYNHNADPPIMKVLSQTGCQPPTYHTVGNLRCEFKTNCEVIISLGVMDSPPLLIPQEIGPKNVLTKACVTPIIVDRHLIFNIGPTWHLTGSTKYRFNLGLISRIYPCGLYPPIYVSTICRQ